MKILQYFELEIVLTYEMEQIKKQLETDNNMIILVTKNYSEYLNFINLCAVLNNMFFLVIK